MSVPPWLSALHVVVQVTVQVAPDPQVTLDPAPAVTVQSLPDSHWTLADGPAVSLQVAWLRQSRFELSAAVTVQSVLEVHCVLQEEPQEPVHVEPPAHTNMQPFVWAVHAPVPLKLQAPLAVQEQVVPVQLAGAPDPEVVLEPDEPHDEAARPRKTAVTIKLARFMMPPTKMAEGKGCPVLPVRSTLPASVRF